MEKPKTKQAPSLLQTFVTVFLLGLGWVSFVQASPPTRSEPLVVCHVEECKILAWAELTRQRPTAKTTEYAFLGLVYIHDPTQPLKRDYVRVSYQKLEPIGVDSEKTGEITTTTRRYEVFEVELGMSGGVLKTGTRVDRRTDIHQGQPTYPSAFAP